MYLYLHVLISNIKHRVSASDINENSVLTTREHSLLQVPQKMLTAHPTLTLSPLVSSWWWSIKYKYETQTSHRGLREVSQESKKYFPDYEKDTIRMGFLNFLDATAGTLEPYC